MLSSASGGASMAFLGSLRAEGGGTRARSPTPGGETGSGTGFDLRPTPSTDASAFAAAALGAMGQQQQQLGAPVVDSAALVAAINPAYLAAAYPLPLPASIAHPRPSPFASAAFQTESPVHAQVRYLRFLGVPLQLPWEDITPAVLAAADDEAAALAVLDPPLSPDEVADFNARSVLAWLLTTGHDGEGDLAVDAGSGYLWPTNVPTAEAAAATAAHGLSGQYTSGPLGVEAVIEAGIAAWRADLEAAAAEAASYETPVAPSLSLSTRSSSDGGGSEAGNAAATSRPPPPQQQQQQLSAAEIAAPAAVEAAAAAAAAEAEAAATAAVEAVAAAAAAEAAATAAAEAAIATATVEQPQPQQPQPQQPAGLVQRVRAPRTRAAAAAATAAAAAQPVAARTRSKLRVAAVVDAPVASRTRAKAKAAARAA
ncbi:hypothetical protein Rsub_12807 [Raphidocelis subcapitata]|uniref:Uncharacterized protein n=1 Tax=Raphidocelis subcapitata TaxID=307507 RepID=A0A2V0PLW6_9CHLO|nr:hypothetical protein Rsub_12807 [Raphidocelis subcapitata]|eukprot:GBG00063.1 hypothetical protein Rsub_12807 [Raphidocelis subcapitata]